jgi:hypothetical protein
MWPSVRKAVSNSEPSIGYRLIYSGKVDRSFNNSHSTAKYAKFAKKYIHSFCIVPNGVLGGSIDGSAEFSSAIVYRCFGAVSSFARRSLVTHLFFHLQ